MKQFSACLLASCLVGHAAAQNRTYADWFVIDASDRSGDSIAATSTDTRGSEMLAYRCFVDRNTCMYVLKADTTCEVDEEYPMLVNAASGSNLIHGVCIQNGDSFEMILKPYDVIERSIKDGRGLLGIALPMKSGAFKAIRFSVKGGSAAVEEAERRLEARRASQRRSAPESRPGSTRL